MARTSPEVAKVLSGCLARRREDRFPSARHLASAIEDAIESMGVAATARDVAEFLAEGEFRPDPALLTTGRCAIPHELTMLRPDTVSNMRPVGWRPAWKGLTVKPRVAAAALIAAIGLGAVGASQLERRAPMPSSPAATLAIEDVTISAPPLTPSAAPAASAPSSTAADSPPAASSASKLHPARPGRTRTKTNHERPHSAP
jgi:hypothetical protein